MIRQMGVLISPEVAISKKSRVRMLQEDLAELRPRPDPVSHRFIAGPSFNYQKYWVRHGIDQDSTSLILSILSWRDPVTRRPDVKSCKSQGPGAVAGLSREEVALLRAL